MDMIYKINPELEIPLYRQLVDSIRTAIKQDVLTAGQQLPTVQELTERLGIARGTIKRAYDELEQTGLIEKIQGRGTFVRYQPANSGSRKEQAMAAIDELLTRLDEMGLSASEINIFLNLKLRQRAEAESHVKVAVVECNPENLSQMSDQLRHIGGVDLYAYLLDSIQQYPYKLGEDFDLVVTTSAHAEYLESVLPAKKRVVRVALRPSARYLSHMIKLRSGTRLGILSYSQRFGQLLYTTCQTYTEDVLLTQPKTEGSVADLPVFLREQDAVLVPRSYEKYFGSQTLEQLRSFHGTLIDCYYEMDEGSVLYLEAKIKRLLEEKTVHAT